VPQHVCNGATMTCSFGTVPAQLVVLPVDRVRSSSQPAATIMDHVPMMHVQPFGLCMSIANPAVAAATAAALGVLTPQPCMPMTPAPWVPGSPTVTLGNKPALSATCQLQCLWAGLIQIVSPGQFAETVA